MNDRHIPGTPARQVRRRQRGEEDDEEDGMMYTKRKQDLWDAQYLRHHDNLTSMKGAYKATYILNEILSPRPETPLLDERATTQELGRSGSRRSKKICHLGGLAHATGITLRESRRCHIRQRPSHGTQKELPSARPSHHGTRGRREEKRRT